MKKSSFKKSFAMFLAILMFVTSFPVLAFATVEADGMPAPNTTKNQPYISGEPSAIYRIPTMVTLNSGTIVTAVDARWNGGMDGGGNDTMIARSTDNGKTWQNQFVNYYPDNGNVFNKASTSVCDSELVTDGENVYMLTVFFPAGYALNAASCNNQLKSNNGTAFYTESENAALAGKLKLSLKGSSAFEYYLGEFNAAGPDGRAPIMKNDGTETGYFADHDYYLYKGTNKQDGNLFYSDGQYQTAKVNFLLYRKSTDDGQTWSDFTPVNVKNAKEAFFGLGPGRGVYDAAHHRMIFSTYSWNGSNNSQRTSFIYSDDDGKTWTRSDDFPDIKGVFSGNWSSESALVQLDENTLMCFVRNGWKRLTYAIARWDGTKYNWDAYKDGFLYTNGTPATGDVGSQSGCQLSAIKYSKQLQYNGNYYTAVLLSTPQGERSNGVIYTILLDDDYNFVNINSSKKENDKNIEYAINRGDFGYSCLTEMPDGSVSILYEASNGTIIYNNYSEIQKLTGLRVPEGDKTYEYALAKGDERTFFVDTNEATNSDDTVVSTKFTPRKGVNATMGDSAAFDGETIPLSDALYNFEKNEDGSWTIGSMGVYMTIVNPGLPSSVTKGSVTIKQDGDYFKFVDPANEALVYWRDGEKVNQFDQTTAYGNDGGAGANDKIPADRDRHMTLFEVYRSARVGEVNNNTAIPGYVRITDINDIKSGEQYLIGCQVNGVYYFLYPSTSTNNTYSHSVKVDTTEVDAGYFMTVKALKKGEATVKLNATAKTGETTYIFKVSDYSNEILGVVDYDPVIYTHGTDVATPDMSHTYVGNVISDATYGGEKETCYRFRTVDGVDLSEQYRITGVTALSDDGVDSAKIEGAEITLTDDDGVVDGRLHGYLPLADNANYKSYESGTYVLLKTTLEEIATGETYTQTDKLYVASNPVAGHIIYGFNADRGGTFYQTFKPQMCTFVLAQGSYGNTVGLNQTTVGSTYAGFNAKHMYDYNNLGESDNRSLVYRNSAENMTQINTQEKDLIKGAGIVENWNESKEDSRDITQRLTDAAIDNGNGLKSAYYYYDKSSPKNEGITKDKNDPSNFSIVLSRQAVDVEYGADSVWDKTCTLYDGSYIKKLAGSGSIIEQTNMFGAPDTKYTILSSEHQKDIAVQCSTKENNAETVEPNTTKSLTGVIRYREGINHSTEKKVALTWYRANYSYSMNIQLPFEIKMCDKSNERNEYNKTIEHVLKSTDYTTTTWTKYMSSVLLYQEYLNNYTLLTTEAKKANTDKTYTELLEELGNGTNEPGDYTNIQKSAQFSDLKNELDNNADTYETGIILPDGNNYTPDSFLKFLEAYDKGQDLYDKGGNGEYLPDSVDLELFPSEDEKRAETPGWEIGPFNTTKLPVQKEIEDDVKAIQDNQPVLSGDDSAYLAAKEESLRIDKTAYINQGDIDSIVQKFDETDALLYKDFIYNDVNYGEFLNLSASKEDQDYIDFQTAANLENMEVIKERNNLRKYSLTLIVNGETITDVTGLYNYGEIVDVDFAKYISDDLFVKCVVNTDADDDAENAEATKTPTTVNLEDYAEMGYLVPVLMQEDVTITVTTAPKTDRAVTVVDYYGTVLGVLYGDNLTVSGKEITVDNQTITAKLSPKFAFTGWTLADGDYAVTEAMIVTQTGTFNPAVHIFSAVNGTINGRTEFNVGIINEKLILDSETGSVWTRTVNGSTYLASYEKNFINFSSNEDVTYTAYNSIAELPENLRSDAEKGIPVVYGTGYFVNDKFTMSVDYSAPIENTEIKVLDAGVIYSDTDLGDEGLVKGAAGTRTVAANRIAHWSNEANSGTFTVSKGNAATGTHYMRAYVSYTAPYTDPRTNETYMLPYVAYSPVIFKCVDGTVSSVD